ncbi:hypothetical protein B2G49_01685 [Halomonas sp. 'Soap Lake |nr:hypothetical protein B2G49_01685 [Halomonas sp. 'Soap Lake \
MTTLAGLTLATLLSPSAFALNEEAQAAKEEGMRLYGIRRADTAIPYLEQAAEAGDVEAMYYLGEANRRLVMGNMNQAALDWYYQAAQHGEPYAMLRLFDGGACELGDVCPENGDDWPQEALELTLPKAEAGDAEAMAALYNIYYYVEDPDEDEAMKWLHRAAEAGNANAMNWLGELARNDEQGYANETERLEAAEVWFNQGAEHGYAPAIHNLSLNFMELGQPEQAWRWMQLASDKGHIDARLGVGWCYLEPERDALCQNNQDIVKGVGILSALRQQANLEMVKGLLNNFKSQLSRDQLAAAEAIKEEWLAKEPSLSQFPEKFGP